jgi:hypothetical protein
MKLNTKILLADGRRALIKLARRVLEFGPKSEAIPT